MAIPRRGFMKLSVGSIQTKSIVVKLVALRLLIWKPYLWESKLVGYGK